MLRLHLTVLTGEGPGHDVTVELADDHRVRDLSAALAAHVSPGTAWADGLGCTRLGRMLDPTEPVATCGLLSGDTVRFASPTDGRHAASPDIAHGLVCEVTNGPSAGAALTLTPGGRFAVGRDAACALPLDDPTVSRHHATLEVTHDGRLAVVPADAATNAVLVDGQPLAGPTEVAPGTLVQLGASALVVRQREREDAPPRDQLGQIPFNRTPYQHPDLQPREIRGPGDPPQPHEPRPFVALAALAPIFGAVVIAWALGRWIFLIFAILSPISMAATWWSERRRSGASNRDAAETFERRLETWIERYDAALAEERSQRYAAAPDLADLRRRAQLRTYDLWPRSPDAGGFLELRLGLGTIAAATTTPRPRGADADPEHRVETLIDEREHLSSVPLTVDLAAHGVVAVHGAREAAEDTVASLVVQLATLHSPDELVLAVAVAPERTLARWVTWIPHTRSVSSPLASEHVAVGHEAATDLVRSLLEVAAERDTTASPRVVVLLDERCEVDAALVSALLEHGPSAAIHAVWLGVARPGLPRQASAVASLPAAATGDPATLWFTAPGRSAVRFVPDRIGADAAHDLARALTPVRDASSTSAAASIPRIAPLLETLRTPSLDADEVARRWQRPLRDALDAPIGVGGAGPLVIDLVEHGPHGLIAGTSGAGKSELLQSYIAALIANHPPTRLNLLFIDYKGGASSNVFQAAPHTVGYVTNLGADLAMRALVSLRAELDRRMRLMEGRAKDLGEMLERHPDEAPASLVIVVDEFATLVKEIPDFVAGMVDVAQRGRSLGIHLILATQRPSGAVNDNILANTNLRISLRVLDPTDSSSILGTPDAAHVPAPLRGRGFAKLGAGTLAEFQSAFSGATFTAATGTTPVAVSDFPEGPATPTTLHPAPAPAASTARTRTHLDVLMEAVVGATEQLRMSRGRRPWLEDLPRELALEDVRAGAFGDLGPLEPGRDVALGVRDEPAHQRQRPHVVDLESSGGLLIFGTGGSGRTTALRTVLGSAVAGASPDEVEAHVLDFGGRTLGALADLPHVAAVSASDDVERTTRTLQHLKAEIARRQELLAAHRAEHLTAYHAADPSRRLPRLLVLLDGYETFDRTFDRGELYRWGELLIEIALTGRAAGVHLIATADRRISVPAPLLNAVSERLVLRSADADALIDLGIPAPVARDARLGDGRVLTGDGQTVQVALVGGAREGAGQTTALLDLGQVQEGGRRAALPELPTSLDRGSLPTSTDPVSFPLGIADLTLAPVSCDVRLHHVVVVGPPESGRSTALRTAACGLREAGADVWVIAPPTSPLASESFVHSTTDRVQHGPLLDELAEAVASGRDGPVPILVVDGAEKLDDAAGRTLERLLADEQVRVVASVDGGTLSGYVAGWVGTLKGTRRMLLLQPDALGDLGMLTPTRIQLRPGQPFPEGRGVLVQGRRWDLVQVAH